MNWWTRLCVTTAITALQEGIKNPQAREKMRQVARQMYDTLLLVYPEFQEPQAEPPYRRKPKKQ